MQILQSGRVGQRVEVVLHDAEPMMRATSGGSYIRAVDNENGVRQLLADALELVQECRDALEAGA